MTTEGARNVCEDYAEYMKSKKDRYHHPYSSSDFLKFCEGRGIT